jgi:AcrR family transcriptional regulator
MPARTLTTGSDLHDAGEPSPTARKLLSAAMTMVHRGRVPSVAEVALEAGVSRATAYRCFSGRGKLIAAVVAESLAPVRRYVPQENDGKSRLQELFTQTFPQFTAFEPHMRAALQLALEHESLERAGLLEEEQYRRGFRRGLLRRAAAQLERELGPKRYDRLLKALSMIYGIEPYVVLKDIWGVQGREVEAIARWMLDAMVDAALREKPEKTRTATKPRARPSR